MREFICVVCGAKGIDNSHTQKRKYCSKQCSDYYHHKKRYSDSPCKYNEGVVCVDHKCNRCGWNPDVARKRAEAMV